MRQLLVNQGWRDAWVLADLDDEVLIEYAMPNGSTALRIAKREDIKGKDSVYLQNYRSVSYVSLPKKWLVALGDEEWEGMPQRGRLPGTPVQELWLRFKAKKAQDCVLQVGIWPAFECYRGPTNFVGWKVSFSTDGRNHKIIGSFDNFRGALEYASQYAKDAHIQEEIFHHFTYNWTEEILRQGKE